MKNINLNGWGSNSKYSCKVFTPSSIDDLKTIKENFLIARGMGRSYGDSSYLTNATVSMKKFNKILFFDKIKGIIKCQSGCTINQILELIIPNGWFFPVTPGTKFVSVGGMVASNVHGKNHHEVGSFNNFVNNFKIFISKKVELYCDKNTNSEIFYETFGAMGLTGIITEVEFSLKRIYSDKIIQRKYFSRNIEELIKLHLNLSDNEYLVSWINCAQNKINKKSITFVGNHYKPDKISKINFKKKYRISLPFFGVNFLTKSTIKILNYLYFKINKIFKNEIKIDILDYFYPLDKFHNWNNIYGKSGFFQIQFVTPLKYSSKVLNEALDILIQKSDGSFITVIKKMKDEKINRNSFTFLDDGFTFAVDLSYNKKNLKIYKEIEDLILKYHGKMNLTKDSLMNKDSFNKMYKKDDLSLIEKKYSSNDLKFLSEQFKRLKK